MAIPKAGATASSSAKGKPHFDPLDNGTCPALANVGIDGVNNGRC